MTKELERRPKADTIGVVGTSGFTPAVNGGPIVGGANCRRGLAGKPKPGRDYPVLEALERLREQNKDLTHKNHSLIELVGSVDLLKLAYELIKSKPGNMTPGSDKETLDGIDNDWINLTSKRLKNGTFEFRPARRIYIPKPGKPEKRPLGIAPPRDKIVQKSLELVLSAIYEPSFKDSSHGFRPGRGNHTALKFIKYNFVKTTWVIEGDLTKCFDTIDHKTLLNTLKKRISCELTLQLIHLALKAGYIDPEFPNSHQSPDVGTPQGSVVSPLLANIILHEFDTYIEELQKTFSRGTQRKANPIYQKMKDSLRRSKLTDRERNRISKAIKKVKTADPFDPNFRRLRYVRYADDFIVGIIGSYREAEEIKSMIREFLQGLKLELNEEKTKITHFSRKPLIFLGTLLVGKDPGEKRIIDKTRNGKTFKSRAPSVVKLKAPLERLMKKALEKGFLRDDKGLGPRPTSLGWIIQLDHADIIKYYNSVMTGIVNFYSFAENKYKLDGLITALRKSCALTLAKKYKLQHAAACFSKLGRTLKCPQTGIEIKNFNLKKETRTFLINPPLPDGHLSKNWALKLTRTNLDKNCLICEASTPNMHHVKLIKDLKSKNAKGEIDLLTLQMRAINRKQIPLCWDHHMKYHHNKLSPEERIKLKAAMENYFKKLK